MANVVGDYVLDNGLRAISMLADAIFLCSQDPLSFTDATVTYAMGSKNFGPGLAFTPPAAGSPNGRQITSQMITNGNATATGTANKWAVVDTINSRLLANGSLSAPLGLVSGNLFTLSPFNIKLPAQ